MNAAAALDGLSNAQLVPLFNMATGEKVVRFSDRRTGVERIKAAIEARPELALVLVDGSPSIERRETEEERRASPLKLDLAILDILSELGRPSKIGAIRAILLQRDEAFAALREKQAKGRMRASVQRLEAASRLEKNGSLFSLPPKSGN